MNDANIFFASWLSPVGTLYLYVNDEYVLALTFEANRQSVAKRLGLSEAVPLRTPLIDETIKQLEEYFSGGRKEFDLPLLLKGTDFQKRAWNFLLEIPSGTVVSYREQALRMTCANAIRAVGSANGKNPISIIIPCHRVLGSNGKISGYSAGPEVKRQLLEREGL